MISVEMNSKTDTTQNLHNELFVKFGQEVELPKYVSLSNITLWHTWVNIENSEDYWFHLVSDLRNVVVDSKIKIRKGSYTVQDINFLIWQAILNGEIVDINPTVEPIISFNRPASNPIETRSSPEASEVPTPTPRPVYNSPKDYPVRLFISPTYNRVLLEVKGGWRIEFSEKLRDLLGAEEQDYTKGEHIFPLPAKMRPVEKILVHSDIIYNPYQAGKGTLLFSFTPVSNIGHLESPKIYFPIWRITREAKVTDMRLWLTDQDFRPLKFEDEWSVTLLLKN